MKRNYFLKVSMGVVGIAVLIILLVWVIDILKYPRLSNVEVTERLIGFLNQQLSGTQIKTDPKTAMVKPAGKGRYWVTLKNISITTDLSWLVNILDRSTSPEKFYPTKKNLLPQVNPTPEINTAHIDEIFLLYGPKEKYLSARSIKGFGIQHDFQKSGQVAFPNQGFNLKKIRAIVENMTFSDFNIGELINAGKRKSGPIPVDPETGKEPRSDTNIEHLKIEALYINENGQDYSVLMTIKTFQLITVGVESSLVSNYIMKTDAPLPDLKMILEKGLAYTDFKIELGRINISVGMNGMPVTMGGLDNLIFSAFVKPDDSRAFFKWGYSVGLKNLAFSIPGNRAMELISKINDCQFMFSMEHLGPEAMQALLDFAKESIAGFEAPGGANVQEAQFRAMKLFTAILGSSPVITYSLSPCRHYFGEMSAKATIQSLFPPTGELEVKIPKLNDILAKIQAAYLFSPEAFKKISETLEKYMVRQQNGDSLMLIQVRPDHPGKFFLNGKTIEIKPMNMPQ